MSPVYFLVVVCASIWCEPYVGKYTPEYPYYYDYSSQVKPTEEWCRNNLSYHIRDDGLLSPETKDIYYFHPKFLGFRGAEFIPKSLVCWPKPKGPQ